MRRQCWICYLEDDTDEQEHKALVNPQTSQTSQTSRDEWIQPCRCSGSTKWVHQSCLLAWIDKCLAGAASTPPSLSCPQCHHPYTIQERLLFPRPLVQMVDWMVSWRPAITFGALMGSVAGSCWVLCTIYGVGTFTICVGPTEASEYFMEHGRPLWSVAQAICFGTRVHENLSTLIRCWWKLAVGMPMIPLAILSQKYRVFSHLNQVASAGFLLGNSYGSSGFMWTPGVTAAVLPWIYRGYQTVLGYVSVRAGLRRSTSTLTQQNGEAFEEEFGEDEEAEMTLKVSEDSVSTLLILPAASALLGHLLFSRLNVHQFHRTCLGGAVLLLVGDVTRMVYRWQAEYARRSRRVLDYEVSKRRGLCPYHRAVRHNTLSLL